MNLIAWLKGLSAAAHQSPSMEQATAFLRCKNPGAPRPYQEAVTLGLIDGRVASLVAAMNVEGLIETKCCCEGHWRKRGSRREVNLPYVWFNADIELVRKLNRALIERTSVGSGRLNFDWIVEYSHGFSLRPYMPEFPNAATRQKLDEDFLAIEMMVKQLTNR